MAGEASTKFRQAAQRQISKDPVLTDQGETLDEAGRGQFRRGFDKASVGLKENAFNALRAVGEKTGLEAASRFGAEGAERASAEASALPRLAQPKLADVTNVGDVIDWALGGLGQVAPSIGATVAGSVAGAAAGAALPIAGAATALAGAGGFLASAVPEFGSAFEDIEEATGEQAFWTALATGSAVGALDKLGVNRLIKAGVPQNTVRRMLTGEALDEAETLGVRNIAKATLSEGATEGAQEFIGTTGRATQIEGLDPLSDEAFEQYFEAAALGMLAGGTIGTAGAGAKALAGQGGRALDALPSRAQPAPVTPPTPELQPLPDEVRAEIDALPVTEDGAKLISPLESRGVGLLRENLDSGALQAQLERIGASNPAAVVQAVEDAVALSEKLIQNPDTPPKADELAFIDAVFSNPFVEQYYTSALQAEGVSISRQNELHDAAVAQTTLQDQEADLRAQGVDPLVEAEAQSEADAAPDIDERDATETSQVDEFDSNLSIIDQNEQAVEFEGFAVPGGKQKPLQTLDATVAAARAKDPDSEPDFKDKLPGKIKALNEANQDVHHEAVSLRHASQRAAEAKARELSLTGTAATEYVNQQLEARARRQLGSLPESAAVRRLWNEESPAAFLDNFNVIQKTAKGGPKGFDEGSFSEQDLKIHSFKDVIEKGTKGAILFEHNRERVSDPDSGLVSVVVDGQDRQLNAIALTFREMNRNVQRASDDFVTKKKQVKEAFLRGMSVLMSNPHKEIKVGSARDTGENLSLKQAIALRDADAVTAKEQGLGWDPAKGIPALDPELAIFRQKGGTMIRLKDVFPEHFRGETRSQKFDAGQPLGEKRKVSQQMDLTRARLADERAADVAGTVQEQPRLQQQEGEVRTNEGVSGVTAGFNADKMDFSRDTLPLHRKDSDYRAQAALEFLYTNAAEGVFQSDVQSKWFIKFVKDNVLDPEMLAEYNQEVDTDSLYFLKEALRIQAKQAFGAQAKQSVPTVAADGRKLTKGERQKELNRKLLAAMGAKRKVVKSATTKELEAQVEKFRQQRREFKERRKQWVKQAKQAGKNPLSDKSLALLEDNDASKEQRAMVRESVAAYVKKLGFGKDSVTFYDTREILTKHPEVANTVITTLKEGKFGFQFEAADGTLGIYINPLIDQATALEQAGHEVGHAAKTLVAGRMTELQARQIIKEFQAWRDEHQASDVSAADVLTSKKTWRAKLAALAGNTSQLRVKDLSAADQEYLLDFDEWFADRVAVALLTGTRQQTQAVEAQQKVKALRKQVAALEAELETATGVRSQEIQKLLWGDFAAARRGEGKITKKQNPGDNALIEDKIQPGLKTQLELEEARASRASTKRKASAFQRYTAELKRKLTTLYDNSFSTQKDANEFIAIVSGAAQNQDSGVDVWQVLSAKGMMPKKINFSEEATTDGTFEEQVNEVVRRATGMSISELLLANNVRQPEEFVAKLAIAAASGATGRGIAWSQINTHMMTWVFRNALAPEERAVLGRTAMSPHIQAQLHDLLRGDPKALERLANHDTHVEASIAYTFAFNQAGMLKVRQEPQGIFDRIARMLRQLIGLIEETEQVHQIYTALDHSQLILNARTFTLRPALRNNQFRILIQDLGEHKRKFGAKWNPLTAANQVLMNTGNPALMRLAREFDNSIGQVGNRSTFTEERTQRAAAFLSVFDRIMKGTKKEEQDAVLDLLRNYVEQSANADPAVKAKADQILILFDDLFEYFEASNLVGRGEQREDGSFIGMQRRGPEVTVTDADGNTRRVAAYYPWTLDPERLLTPEGMDNFRQLLRMPEYEKKMDEMRNEMILSARRRANREGATDAEIAAGPHIHAILEGEHWKDYVIDTLLTQLQSEYGVVDAEPDLDPNNIGHIPSMKSSNPRSWAWVTESFDKNNPVTQEARDLWFGLQTDSLAGGVHTYIEQGVKRATYVKRFNKNGSKLARILEEAVTKYGATETDIHNAQKYIDAMLGTHGAKTHMALAKGWNEVRRAVGKTPLPLPKPGAPINSKLMKVQQWLMTYQNLRILDFAVITSLMDPVGIFARTGDLKLAWQSYKDGINDVYRRRVKGDQTMLESVAETLGIIEATAVTEALQWNYSGNFMTGRAKAVNDAFFKWNGLHGWTRTTRLMATSAGMQFLKHHTNFVATNRAEAEALIRSEDVLVDGDQGLTPEQKRLVERYRRSTRYLLELGILEGDLTAESFSSEDGTLKLMTAGEFSRLEAKNNAFRRQGLLTAEELAESKRVEAQLAREQRLRTAMIRFTNEAVLRPNAAQRPIWASDPHFAVFFHLKQFIWSFHSRILGRMGHEAMNGNAAPVLYSAMLFMVVMGGADQLREYLKHGSEGNPNTAHWGFTDHVWHAIQRAGLTGTYQSMIDANEDTNFGGFGFESFAGPTVNHAMQVIGAPFKESDQFWKQLDKAMPFNNLRDTTEVLNLY